MLVLVDMDGVVADFEAALYERMAELGGERRAIVPAERSAFRAAQDYLERFGARSANDVTKVVDEPGFYATLSPVPGAPGALAAMLEYGWDVRLCSTPKRSNPTCASDKAAWALRHLGDGWDRRLVLSSDKTLVRGDVLVDDRPELSGSLVPSWRHVIFDTPYNRDVPGPRIVGWRHWIELGATLEAADG